MTRKIFETGIALLEIIHCLNVFYLYDVSGVGSTGDRLLVLFKLDLKGAVGIQTGTLCLPG